MWPCECGAPACELSWFVSRPSPLPAIVSPLFPRPLSCALLLPLLPLFPNAPSRQRMIHTQCERLHNRGSSRWADQTARHRRHRSAGSAGCTTGAHFTAAGRPAAALPHSRSSFAAAPRSSTAPPVHPAHAECSRSCRRAGLRRVLASRRSPRHPARSPAGSAAARAADHRRRRHPGAAAVHPAAPPLARRSPLAAAAPDCNGCAGRRGRGAHRGAAGRRARPGSVALHQPLLARRVRRRPRPVSLPAAAAAAGVPLQPRHTRPPTGHSTPTGGTSLRAAALATLWRRPRPARRRPRQRGRRRRRWTPLSAVSGSWWRRRGGAQWPAWTGSSGWTATILR